MGTHIFKNLKMTNIEKYNQAFIEVFNVQELELSELHYKGIPSWDSVGHMTLIATLEEYFGFEFNPEDIMNLISYKKGISILKDLYRIRM